MRLSKPSPAMIVALLALSVALSGTGIAATVLITGAQIQNNSITSADIKNGSLTSTDIANGTIALTDLGLNITAPLYTACGSTTPTRTSTVKTIPCTAPATSTQYVQAYDALTGLQQVINNAPKPLNGTNGSNAGSTLSSRVSFTGLPPTYFATFVGANGNPAPQGTFKAVATVTPATVTQSMMNVNAALIGPPPANANNIVVTLVVAGVPGGSASQCHFDPTSATSCTIAGPISIPPGSTIGWKIEVFGIAGPSPIGPFDMSLAPIMSLTP